MIPLYFYYTIYHYNYAGISYDIIVAPLLHFFIDYHQSLVIKVERERRRIKALEQHDKIKVGAIKDVECLGFFQKIIYKTFNVDNMYLLK